MKTCKSCRFRSGDGGATFCHRYPPTLHFQQHGSNKSPAGVFTVPSGTYPPVAIDRFWCGEWRFNWRRLFFWRAS